MYYDSLMKYSLVVKQIHNNQTMKQQEKNAATTISNPDQGSITSRL